MLTSAHRLKKIRGVESSMARPLSPKYLEKGKMVSTAGNMNLHASRKNSKKIAQKNMLRQPFAALFKKITF